MQMRSDISTRMLPFGPAGATLGGLGSCRRRVMHGNKTRAYSVAHSSIADWFALNSNELTWIALATVGVIAVGMLM